METRKRSRKPARKRKALWKRGPWGIMILMTALFVLLSIGGCSALYVAGNQMIDEKKLDLMETSTVYAADGTEIARLSIENREKVTIDKIPKHVIDAFVATEDNRFYEHNGVDPIGIGRAIVKDIITRSKAEGASTITQQLARNVFLSHDKTFMRKTKEMMIALNLERKYSKQQILEMYLNRFYAGNGVFGVQTAAKYYFGKDVSQLSLAEGATLAALPKAPNTYSPREHPEAALKRRNLVLALMQKNGYITQQQMKQAQQEPLVTIPKPEKKKTNEAYQAYVDYLAEEAEDVLGITGDQLYQGGYKIYTYLDRDAQKAMFEEYEKDRNFPKGKEDQKVQSAMVIMETKTGGITAMVGGRDYEPKGLNRAKARVQPGSTIKPLIAYAPALEKGWTPSTIVKDEKRTYREYNNWTPRNYRGEGYAGSITMKKALVDSRNAATVWTLNEVGLSTGVSYLKKFGLTVEPDEENNLALALGGMNRGASPIQMAQAYSAFANEGKMNKAHVIKKITTRDGTVVVEEKKEESQVVTPQTAYYMTEMLESAVREGTGRRAQFGHPLAGKTGTQQYESKKVSGGTRYAWFVGYTPDYVGAIYMGYDKTDDQHYLNTSGGGAPAQLFSRVMKKAMEGKERKDFERPEGIEQPVEQPEASVPSIGDLSATVDESGSKVQVNWSGTNDSRIKYRLYRFLGSVADKQLIADTDATSYTDAYDPNNLYTYVVVPYNAETGEEGTMSNMAKTTVPDVLPGQKNENQPADPNQPNPQAPNQPVDSNNPNSGDQNQQGNGNNKNPDDVNKQPDSGMVNPTTPTNPEEGNTETRPAEEPKHEKSDKGNGNGNGWKNNGTASPTDGTNQ
jgi:penicillin-binding protein 2A